MNVRCAQASIECRTCQGNTRYKGWKLTRCGHREEWIIERRTVSTSQGEHGRKLSTHRCMGDGRARVVDTVPASHRHPFRTQRRVGKSNTRTEIVWIDASEDIFAPFGQARQVKTRNNISGLDKTSGRRSNRAPGLVHLLARHGQSRIE